MVEAKKVAGVSASLAQLFGPGFSKAVEASTLPTVEDMKRLGAIIAGGKDKNTADDPNTLILAGAGVIPFFLRFARPLGEFLVQLQFENSPSIPVSDSLRPDISNLPRWLFTPKGELRLLNRPALALHLDGEYRSSPHVTHGIDAIEMGTAPFHSSVMGDDKYMQYRPVRSVSGQLLHEYTLSYEEHIEGLFGWTGMIMAEDLRQERALAGIPEPEPIKVGVTTLTYLYDENGRLLGVRSECGKRPWNTDLSDFLKGPQAGRIGDIDVLYTKEGSEDIFAQVGSADRFEAEIGRVNLGFVDDGTLLPKTITRELARRALSKWRESSPSDRRAMVAAEPRVDRELLERLGVPSKEVIAAIDPDRDGKIDLTRITDVPYPPRTFMSSFINDQTAHAFVDGSRGLIDRADRKKARAEDGLERGLRDLSARSFRSLR